MKKIVVYPCRKDFNIDEFSKLKGLKLLEKKNKNFDYKTICFNDLSGSKKIKELLKKEINFFYKKHKIIKNPHILVVGLGNKSIVADSLGSLVSKKIKINSYLENFNIKIKGPKISSIEPGVFSKTGILTEKIVYSVVKEIKPDFVILIDSFISDDIEYLNKTIHLSDEGIIEGSGILGISSTIDSNLLKVPVLAIGATTAIELKITAKKENFIPYILSTKNIDNYINDISSIISSSINEFINDL